MYNVFDYDHVSHVLLNHAYFSLVPKHHEACFLKMSWPETKESSWGSGVGHKGPAVSMKLPESKRGNPLSPNKGNCQHSLESTCCPLSPCCFLCSPWGMHQGTKCSLGAWLALLSPCSYAPALRVPGNAEGKPTVPPQPPDWKESSENNSKSGRMTQFPGKPTRRMGSFWESESSINK